jgi:hypothetical protein
MEKVTARVRRLRGCEGSGAVRCVKLLQKMCEGCGEKQASFGLVSRENATKKRWCAGCGAAKGAVPVYKKMCESCGLKQPNYGLAVDRVKRWCSTCGGAHLVVEIDVYKLRDNAIKHESFRVMMAPAQLPPSRLLPQLRARARPATRGTGS